MIFMRLTSECFNRRIRIYSVIEEDQCHEFPDNPSAEALMNPAMHFLFFNETSFTVGHFQVNLRKIFDLY